ncbi:SRPBCC family protein [Amycolatopsis nigrescens]|uniref:SRPBCC family protein n=1 Tax=Amycolatopsis nigrescens TaxID=381445 RepID=UPI000382B1E4|nr:SRPBCC family protein [Amycolatopsis nigrescens]
MLGTLHPTEDGRMSIRFERTLRHPPEKVWRAITEAERLNAWFAVVVDRDLVPGGRVRFDLTPEAKRRMGIEAGADTVSEGEVTVFEAPERLEYTWADEILRWRLNRTDDGGCHLVFINIFDLGDQPVGDWMVDMASGWHACLDHFEAWLSDSETTFSPWDRAAALAPSYSPLVS